MDEEFQKSELELGFGSKSHISAKQRQRASVDTWQQYHELLFTTENPEFAKECAKATILPRDAQVLAAHEQRIAAMKASPVQEGVEQAPPLQRFKLSELSHCDFDGLIIVDDQSQVFKIVGYLSERVLYPSGDVAANTFVTYKIGTEDSLLKLEINNPKLKTASLLGKVVRNKSSATLPRLPRNISQFYPLTLGTQPSGTNGGYSKEKEEFNADGWKWSPHHMHPFEYVDWKVNDELTLGQIHDSYIEEIEAKQAKKAEQAKQGNAKETEKKGATKPRAVSMKKPRVTSKRTTTMAKTSARK